MSRISFHTPVVTEKSSSLLSKNVYIFYVDLSVNKIELVKFLEKTYNVKVSNVNSLVVKGKAIVRGRFKSLRPDRKKMIVTLKDGFFISDYKELF